MMMHDPAMVNGRQHALTEPLEEAANVMDAHHVLILAVITQAQRDAVGWTRDCSWADRQEAMEFIRYLRGESRE